MVFFLLSLIAHNILIKVSIFAQENDIDIWMTIILYFME